MNKSMNDRQRVQLAAYAAEADRISEDWQIKRWISRATTFLAEAMGADEADRFRSLDAHSIYSELALKLGHLEGLMAKGEDEPTTAALNSSDRQGAGPEPIPFNTREVFVVHGHDGEAKESVARFLEKLGLTAVILHEQANEGRTLIEKFETRSRGVAFAVILLTPDDLGRAADGPPDLHPRARQNVILELGYFMGRLGRTRVCALYKGEVDLPSDFQGIVYIEFDHAGAWKAKLAQELVGAKLTIKLEGLIN
jgi:predicted nucleotide-binding protein